MLQNQQVVYFDDLRTFFLNLLKPKIGLIIFGSAKRFFLNGSKNFCCEATEECNIENSSKSSSPKSAVDNNSTSNTPKSNIDLPAPSNQSTPSRASLNSKQSSASKRTPKFITPSTRQSLGSLETPQGRRSARLKKKDL